MSKINWKNVAIVIALAACIIGIGYVLTFAETCEQRCYRLNQNNEIAYTQCQAKC